MIIKIGKMLMVNNSKIANLEDRINISKIKIETPHKIIEVLGRYGKLRFFTSFLVRLAANKTAIKIITPEMISVETKATDKTAGI